MHLETLSLTHSNSLTLEAQWVKCLAQGHINTLLWSELGLNTTPLGWCSVSLRSGVLNWSGSRTRNYPKMSKNEKKLSKKLIC